MISTSNTNEVGWNTWLSIDEGIRDLTPFSYLRYKEEYDSRLEFLIEAPQYA